MRVNFIHIVFAACLSALPAQAVAEPDPELIIAQSRSVYRTIRDFSAEVEIEVNIDFINIPNKMAEIIYKYPDKIKFRSTSFIMIPKKGIGFMMLKILEMDYSAIYIGKKFNKGHELHEIKLIPLDDDSEIVLATLFIDPEDHLIYFMEATTKDAGFFSTEFVYGDHPPLPLSNKIRFEVDEVRLPLKFLGKVNKDTSKLKKGTMGEVILHYTHYQLNQGVDDDIFFEENETGN